MSLYQKSLEHKILELEEEIEQLEKFTGFTKTGLKDYPYKMKSSNGYWMLYRNRTEKERDSKYTGPSYEMIAEHRYIMIKHLGQDLKGLIVHHINGNKTDNRISNLMVMTKSEHRREHLKKRNNYKENI